MTTKRDDETGKLIPELRRPAGAPADARKSPGRSGMKRPTWEHITFGEIEEARLTLGLPKTKMAELLGVTNSTYHNWKRDHAVPTHQRQQRYRLLVAEALQRLSSGQPLFRAGSGTIEHVRPAVSNAARAVSRFVLRPESVSALCDLIVAYARRCPDQVSAQSLPSLVRDLIDALYD